MILATKDAVFIWCSDDLHYPKELAKTLNRHDLLIVGPSWLSDQRYRGLDYPDIVVDHAYTPPGTDMGELIQARRRAYGISHRYNLYNPVSDDC